MSFLGRSLISLSCNLFAIGGFAGLWKARPRGAEAPWQMTNGGSLPDGAIGVHKGAPFFH